jgi:glycosyltransferase involved in cell wall biosynthesis
MKAVISQTIFTGMATTHGGDREVLRADYDQNGWPQSARNAAVREMRKAFAFHIAGDQHLPAVVHYGIDTQAVAPNPLVKLTLNGKLNLSRDDEVISFVNRNLEPYRGYHVFMRALPEILKNRPNVRVLIVGADDVSYGARPINGQKWKDIFAAEVRPHISDADWSRVHFLGKVPYKHFIPLLQLSTVHVYMTYPFVLSWSLLEAMSAGCAIVASDTQPLHEAIQHNQTGRLVNFFDVNAMTHEICTLLDNPAERDRLGANARQFAQETYDLQTVCLPKQLAWVESLKG